MSPKHCRPETLSSRNTLPPEHHAPRAGGGGGRVLCDLVVAAWDRVTERNVSTSKSSGQVTPFAPIKCSRLVLLIDALHISSGADAGAQPRNPPPPIATPSRRPLCTMHKGRRGGGRPPSGRDGPF